MTEQEEQIATPLKWFLFHQNNSGGHFIVNESVAHDVFVQATTAAEAVRRAGEIGLDPYESYCSCCGTRWSLDYVEDSDGTNQPMKYGKLYSETAKGWFKDEGRLHFIDGHIEVVFPGQEQPARLG